MNEALAEILPFRPSKPPELAEVFIVFEVDSTDEQRRTSLVRGAFSLLEYAIEFVKSRDKKDFISFEIEKHTLDYFRHYE